MLYYNNGELNINFFTYDQIELNFIDKMYLFMKEYPFKWYDFINKIINDSRITYFKDTTMIITLLSIDIKDIKTLFEFFKELLKDKLIKKIIYKKEYFIVHFYNDKTIDILKQKNLWMALYSYKVLNQSYFEGEVYFRGILETNNQKHMIDLIILYKNHLYLINTNNQLQFLYNIDGIKVMLYLDRKVTDFIKDKILINFTLDKNNLLNRFTKLFNKRVTSLFCLSSINNIA